MYLRIMWSYAHIMFCGFSRYLLVGQNSFVTPKAAACFVVSVSSYNLMAVTGMCLNFDPMPVYSKCCLQCRFRLHLVWLKVPFCEDSFKTVTFIRQTALHPLVYLSCHFLLQYVYMSKKNLSNPNIFVLPDECSWTLGQTILLVFRFL